MERLSRDGRSQHSLVLYCKLGHRRLLPCRSVSHLLSVMLCYSTFLVSLCIVSLSCFLRLLVFFDVTATKSVHS